MKKKKSEQFTMKDKLVRLSVRLLQQNFYRLDANLAQQQEELRFADRKFQDHKQLTALRNKLHGKS